MTKLGFAIFETAIGRCGIVWSSRGIVSVQLPEASERATRNRVLRRFAAAREAAPPAEVQRAIDEAKLRGVSVAPTAKENITPGGGY